MTPETGGFKKEHPLPGFIFSGSMLISKGCSFRSTQPPIVGKKWTLKNRPVLSKMRCMFFLLSVWSSFSQLHVFNFRGEHMLRKNMKKESFHLFARCFAVSFLLLGSLFRKQLHALVKLDDSKHLPKGHPVEYGMNDWLDHWLYEFSAVGGKYAFKKGCPPLTPPYPSFIFAGFFIWRFHPFLPGEFFLGKYWSRTIKALNEVHLGPLNAP